MKTVPEIIGEDWRKETVSDGERRNDRGSQCNDNLEW
jgi:hypothetical protein